MLGTTDWLLKRFLKFVLKRNVGKYLCSEIDLEQLDVKLDAGKLELKNLLLNCEAINKDLSIKGWRVKAGYIGSVVAKLPLATLASGGQCSVVVDEVMVTVAPDPPATAGETSLAAGAPSSGSPSPPSSDGGSPDARRRSGSGTPGSGPGSTTGGASGNQWGSILADDFGWMGQNAVMDGVRRIAGSLQSLLQQMKVEATNVLLRAELPHPTTPGRVVTAALKLDLIDLSDLTHVAAGGGAAKGASHGTANGSNQQHKTGSGRVGGRQGPTDGVPLAGPGGAGMDTGLGAAAATAAGGRKEIAKLVQIKGLSLDLFEAAPLLVGEDAALVAASGPAVERPAAAGSAAPPSPVASTNPGVTLVSGPGKHGIQVSMELRMVSYDSPAVPTHISVDLQLGAVRLQLLPSHAVCLSALRNALDQGCGRAQVAADAAGQQGDEGDMGEACGASSAGPDLWASCVSGTASVHSAGGAAGWGRRSLLESIMMPNCETVVAHSLEPYVAGLSYGEAMGVTADEAGDFHDACSKFGSMASSFASSVAQTGTNLIGYVAASGTAAVEGAMGWVSGQQPPSQQQQQQQQSLQGAGQGQASAASSQPPSGPPPPPPPILSIRAHASHAAAVLCYGPGTAIAAHEVTGHKIVSRTGSGAGRSSQHVNGIAPSTAAGTAGGSMVLELQDILADVHLDPVLGSNSLLFQSGTLQVYEQLPSTFAAQYGISALEWSRVPECLPQAPYRFRPTQLAPARANGSHSGSGAGLGAGSSPAAVVGSPRGLGRPQNGRNAQQAQGAALHTWPVLTCASTLHTGDASQNGAAAAASHAAHGRPSSGSGVAAGGASASSSSSILGGNGPPSVRMRLHWTSGGCPRCSPPVGYPSAPYSVPYGPPYNVPYGCCTGSPYDGGVQSGPCPPSVDLSLEVLPVTVWLSLPLVQRIGDFSASLGAALGVEAASRRCSGGGGHVAKPPSPLPRVSMSVAAPHVCVLLALLPAQPPSSVGPRKPGTPVFLAIDVVAPPHHSADTTTHHGTPSSSSHPHLHQHQHHASPPHSHPHHPHPAHPYGRHPHPHAHGPHASPPHGIHGHGYGQYSNQYPYSSPSGVPPWPQPQGHGHGQAAGVNGTGSGAAGTQGWHAGGPMAAPPLLAVTQVPATDRLIPSQVTTVDVAAGVVELLLVRSPAGWAEQQQQQQQLNQHHQHHGPHHHHQQQPHAHASHALPPGPGCPAPWVSKALARLSPSATSGNVPSAPPTASSSTSSSQSAFQPFRSSPSDPCPPVPPAGPGDVPPGCGFSLTVCSDPGGGSAPELVSEAWGHAAVHSQDRWSDPDGEGGAWEERSSFRTVAFHERCRRSSATFVHLRAPKLQLHLTRADMRDLAALPGTLATHGSPATGTTSAPAPDKAHVGPAWANGRAGPQTPKPASAGHTTRPTQTCLLLELCVHVQLVDEPEEAHAAGAAAATAGPGSAAGRAAAVGQAGPGAGTQGQQQQRVPSGVSLGLGLGTRMAMYELGIDEVTMFHASNLGAEPGCNVTSVHAHGVTLRGHVAGGEAARGGIITSHHPQQQQQQHSQRSAAQHGAGTAGGKAGSGRSTPVEAAGATRGSVEQHGQGQHVVCLVHCPRSLGASDKAPACIEYLCVQGRKPQSATGTGYAAATAAPGAHQQAAMAPGQLGTLMGSRRVSLSSASSLPYGGFGGGGGGAGPQRAEVLHSVLLQGVTVSTDHGLVTMDWAEQLGRLATCVAGPQGHAQQQQQQKGVGPAGAGSDSTAITPRGRLVVNVVDLALRHEPLEYPATAQAVAAAQGPQPPQAAAAAPTSASAPGRVSPVALAVIIEAVHFELPLGPDPQPATPTPNSASTAAAHQIASMVPGGPLPPAAAGPHTTQPASSANTNAGGSSVVQQHSLALHSLTLHLAAADARGGGWGAGEARGIRPGLMLQACGYHRVLQEDSLKVVVKQRRYPKRPPAPAAPGLRFRPFLSDKEAVIYSEPEQPEPVPAPASQAAVHPASPDAHTTLDVEITNQHLLGMLTVESATLLAHFAMQVGTLMTAKQTLAAAASSGGASRRNAADGGNDAASELSGVIGGGGCSTALAAASDGGVDAGNALLTAMLLEEVEENAFRCPPAAAAAAAGTAAAGAGLRSGAGGGVNGGLDASTLVHGQGAWYGPGGGKGADGEGPVQPPCLILIDDFFPVNHQGEYDEDMLLVQHPEEAPGGRRGRAGGRWGGQGRQADVELEGTWYGPGQGPESRPTGRGQTGTGPAIAGDRGGPLRQQSLPCGEDDLDLDPSEDPYDSHGDEEYDNGATGDGDAEEDEAESCDAEDIDDLLVGSAPAATSGYMAAAAALATERHGRSIARGNGGGAPAAAAAAADGRRRNVDRSVGGRSLQSAASAATAATASSTAAPTWKLQEDYVRVPRKSDEDGTGHHHPSHGHGQGEQHQQHRGVHRGLGGAADGGPGVEQPPPLVRITFKDFSGIWVMHTAGGSSSASSSSTSSAAASGGNSGLQEGRVELQVEGLCFVTESYGPGGHLARHMKVTVADLEIRDCALQVRQQQAAAAAGGLSLAAGMAGAAADGGGIGPAGGGASGWVRVLGYRQVAGRPRDSRAPLAAVALTAVRPNPAACDPRDEEFRLAVALLPLRLKLTQDIMSYLAWYGSSVSTALKPAASVLATMQASLSDLGGCEPLPPPFFQRVHIRAFSIMLDYRPRRVDIAALAEGKLTELINLVPLGGVELDCIALRLAGLQGWDNLGAAVIKEWLSDISRTQAHKLITGLAPVKAVVNVSSAVATLVSAPARHLSRRDAAGTRQMAVQLRRASASFAYRIVCEAMAAGSTAAKGATRALVRAGTNVLGPEYGGMGEGEGPYGRWDEDGEEAGWEDGEVRGREGRKARRSMSAGAGVGAGGTGSLVRAAAAAVGSASQQVAAGLQGGGLQRGVGSMARVIQSAAAEGVAAAAPASAALHGHLKGTFRSMRRALKAQIKGAAAAAGVGKGAGARAGPHSKEE